jgi:hypothetical protein
VRRGVGESACRLTGKSICREHGGQCLRDDGSQEFSIPCDPPPEDLADQPRNRGARAWHALAGFSPSIGCTRESAATHTMCGGGQIDYVKGPLTELGKIASSVRNRVSKLTSAMEAP